MIIGCGILTRLEHLYTSTVVCVNVGLIWHPVTVIPLRAIHPRWLPILMRCTIQKHNVSIEFQQVQGWEKCSDLDWLQVRSVKCFIGTESADPDGTAQFKGQCFTKARTTLSVLVITYLMRLSLASTLPRSIPVRSRIMTVVRGDYPVCYNSRNYVDILLPPVFK